MRIVNRATFLISPPGTLFAKYVPCAFGDLRIKHETTAGNLDFWYTPISGAVKCDDSEQFEIILDNAVSTGSSFELDFTDSYRDGLYDENQLFAIFEPADIYKLVAAITENVRVKR